MSETSETVQRSVLFADIHDSTRIYAALGDERARRIVIGALDLLVEAGAENTGTLVDKIGDEVMMIFPTADKAAAAASDMQIAVAEANLNGAFDATVHIRCGFHHGDVILEGDRVFGDTVYTARRLATAANGGQIITSDSTLEQVSPYYKAGARSIDRLRLKGKREFLDLFEIVWDQEGATMMMGFDTTPDVASRELLFSYGGRTFVLSEKNPLVTIGRSPDCDLVINDQRASRFHASLEYEKDSFKITDKSTNGMHVIADGGPPVKVHRQSATLNGSGTIGLGLEADANDANLISFRPGS